MGGRRGRLRQVEVGWRGWNWRMAAARQPSPLQLLRIVLREVLQVCNEKWWGKNKTCGVLGDSSPWRLNAEGFENSKRPVVIKTTPLRYSRL